MTEDDLRRMQDGFLEGSKKILLKRRHIGLQLDTTSFAAACGLYVSDDRDSYSDCRPGELTWEKPRGIAS